MADRPTDAVYTDRLTTIYKDLISGKRRPDILQYASAWGVSIRTIDSYIARANAQLERDAETIRKRELGKAHNRYELVFAEALAKGDLKTALQAEVERGRLLGLNAPAQAELTGASGGPLRIEVAWVDSDPDRID